QIRGAARRRRQRRAAWLHRRPRAADGCGEVLNGPRRTAQGMMVAGGRLLPVGRIIRQRNARQRRAGLRLVRCAAVLRARRRTAGIRTRAAAIAGPPRRLAGRVAGRAIAGRRIALATIALATIALATIALATIALATIARATIAGRRRRSAGWVIPGGRA